MSKRHADSTSDENPSKRRRCEADTDDSTAGEVSVATPFCDMDDSTSDEVTPFDIVDRRRSEADEVSVATPFENVCKWCREDKPELLEEVLSKEFAPDTSNIGSPLDARCAFQVDCIAEYVTPLMICAYLNHIECLVLLLDAGAGIDVASSWYSEPRHPQTATATPSSPASASPSSICSHESPTTLTAFHFAARGNLDCLSELITRGASVVAVDSTGNTALHHASLIRGNLNKWNAVRHQTASVHDGPYAQVVNMLLKEGISVDARNTVMKTPLHVACAYDNTSAAVALLKGGASVVAVDCDGSTALHHAVGIGLQYVFLGERRYSTTDSCHRSVKESHHYVVVDMLLERGVSVDARNRQGETPLHLASKCGNDPAVAALLQAGASVDAVDSDHNTALHNVAGMDKELVPYDDRSTIHGLQDAVVSLLLRHGASVDVRNLRRATPLMEASRGSNDYIVRTLLNMGAEVDAVDAEGNTALHCAWLSYDGWMGRDIMSALSNQGTSLDVRNNCGQTTTDLDH